MRALDPDQTWRRFGALWARLKDAARRAGYGPGDVDRLIAEVRKRK